MFVTVCWAYDFFNQIDSDRFRDIQMCKDKYFVPILVMVFVRTYRNDLANENNKKMFSSNLCSGSFVLLQDFRDLGTRRHF